MASVVDLLSVPLKSRTPDHLIEMLRCAAKLEHATLPPYLTAWWSIIDITHPAARILQTVIFEEMGHLATVCNLLRSIGSTPTFTAADFVPRYPSRLPCHIAPQVIPPNVADWKISLSRLTPAVVSDVFMIIEYPEAGPIQIMLDAASAASDRPKYHTIGKFYDAVAATLDHLVSVGAVAVQDNGQLSEAFTGHDEKGQNVLTPITCPKEAREAIEHIKEQGEGTPTSPDAPKFGHELAHYYRFKQIQTGRCFAQGADGAWTLSGNFIDFPPVRPMADIPPDGYEGSGVPQNVRDAINKFNLDYKQLLLLLQSAWDKGAPDGQTDLSDAELIMDGLSDQARTLMSTPIEVSNPGRGNYAPTFRIAYT